ncbi:MAG: hypothetical protein QOF97_3002 [Acidimicrobiaceae bacterium]
MSERSERVTPQPSDRQGAGCAGVWGQRPHGDTA